MLNKLPIKKLALAMLALAVLGLCAITLWAGNAVEESEQAIVTYAEKELRVPAYDSIVYTPLWIEHLQAQPDDHKPWVGLFGASTVYGTTVRDSSNTTSGVMQVHLNDKRVLNLGLTGARLAETYAILASVIDELDYVIYEINYGILPLTDNDPEVTVYPSLLSKLDQNIPKSWLRHSPVKNEESVPNAVHDFMTTEILSHWPLYHDRDVLTYRLLSTRTSLEKLRREVAAERNERQGIVTPYTPPYTPYEQLTAEQQAGIVNHFTNLYTWSKPFHAESSFGLTLMNKTLDLLDKHGKQAVFYTAPLDKDLITRHNMLNWTDYFTVMGAYQELIESRGYPFIEFNAGGSNLIPHEFYHDSSHMVDEGSRIFGEILYERLLPYGITAQ
ncbi:hypothetical protein BK126_20485 [Paenibacillus sp. FSL H7-0326]|uniref:hypothetical protein n=1 Tax=Paenibacillus sp. FSL H7-0326 TaxID=1921144 RepID=UPI00096DA0BA|nr:hypothetical protein [Paenibacillus sp. FSL H7-0326]OMC66395.1 hypothetical protein BK126_20485 [Paenibacillus sp. FSL H7-0326]